MKRYVRDLVRNIIFDLENERDVKRFDSISRNATHIKNGQYTTADTILELAQVGDGLEIPQEWYGIITIKSINKEMFTLANGWGIRKDSVLIKNLWVRQDNNTFKRYVV